MRPGESQMKRINVSFMALATAGAIFLTASSSYGQKTPPPPPQSPCPDSNTVTHLLFPFMTNTLGFDTGFAISNTTADPFGTTGVPAACTFTFYQGTVNPPPAATSIIPPGTTYTGLLSNIAPGFQGYMVATCNFPLAHG